MTTKKKSKKEISTVRSMSLTGYVIVKFILRLVAAFLALAWSGYNIYYGIDSTAWPKTSCQVVATDTDGKGSMLYQYSVKGSIYSGNRIRFGDSTFSNSRADLNDELNQGKELTVKYNPDDPSMSCLMTEFHKLGVYIPLAVGLFFLAMAGLEMRARSLIR